MKISHHEKIKDSVLVGNVWKNRGIASELTKSEVKYVHYKIQDWSCLGYGIVLNGHLLLRFGGA
jgi:hypothetical protein